MFFHKRLCARTALAAALISLSAQAARVDEDAARAAAEGFLAKSTVAARVLGARAVASVTARGSLWIAALAPSGHIILAGSDRCKPVISFSPNDFAEPEAGSPLDVLLRDNSIWVEKMEADESTAVDLGWAKYTASGAKKARLLAASTPTAETSDEYVAPFLGATWHQTAPYNDLSPYNYFCGCVATAAGQEVRYWRWPYRYEKFRTSTHGVRDGLNNYYSFVVRPNGLVPIDWDKVKASYTYESNASTPLANDKVATYNAAYLLFWMQSLGGIGYKPGGSGGTRQLASSAEDYWYEKGVGMTYSSVGYDTLWAAVKADLDWGSPIQINTAAHQMVIDGYAVENAGTADEVDYINLNLGYGNATYWADLRTAVTSGTYSGVLATFQTGYRPQKIVQFEPLAKVCSSDVTLAWHIAPCYTNRTTGFTLEIAGGPTSVSPVNIATHEETTTYTVTGLEDGYEYTFTVTPVMAAGEGEGRANSVTTTIGMPQPAPEIQKISSVACGIELVQQDIFVECARGVVNQLKVTCSESTTSLTNYSSHLTILPDEKISVAKDGNVFTINIDATDMAQRWNVEGEMVVLTLAASNADGTEAYKNLMLRFNSMRNVMGGTFEIVEPNATGPVWFANGTTTTLDAKGQTVVFDATAFQGNGTVTLTDSVGGGSFTFANLNGFTGTLKWSEGLAVNLPADMTGFAGTLSFDSYKSTYHLATSLPATAKVDIGGTTQLYIDNNATIDAAVTGSGYIMVVGSASSFGNTKDFAGHFSLGTDTESGTITLNAGEEKNVAVDNGTVNLVLSKAQVAYGFETSAVTLSEYASWFGLDVALVFLDEEGKQLAKWTSKQNTYSFAATANTWTPDFSTNYGRFSDTARWSFGRMPIAGEYVIFQDTSADGFGSEMQLNLAADMTLEHIKVIGNTKFTISAAIGSATLSANKFENDKRTTLDTDKIQPTLVIPTARLDMAEGITIDCEIASSIAQNLYTPGGVSALYNADYWNGTVVFENRSFSYLEPKYWCNEESKIRFTDASGYVEQGSHFTGEVILKDDGATPALHLNNGYNGDTVTIDKLTGDGTFKISTKALSETFLLKDVSEFTGTLDLATMNVAIADETPSANIGSDGRLHVCKAATVPAGKAWSAAGGLFLGANGALTVNGSLAAKQIYAYGANASLTLEDGATIDVQTSVGGDPSPTLNFKAGTYKVENNVAETKTVNFCAAAGKRTTLDANGHVVTLGPKFFSGSGDVHLTSSQSGGKFILQGVGADFTGTIRGGRSVMFEAKYTTGDRLVTVSKSDRIKGLTIDSVTLSDDTTMTLQDTDGNELAKFSPEDAVNGKYVLAPDADIEPTCVLDFEFNGNATSTGAETPTLWGGNYYEGSALYTRSTPYITTDFTMPSDEWTAVVRGTLPAANSSTPTILLMFGVNGGNLFGLMAGTEENTVALADKGGLIGNQVIVENATTQYHVYTIVKTAGRVKLYVDGELRLDEAATISVKNRFQFGSVHGSNNTSYATCTGDDSRIDFFKFYDFAADADFEEMVYTGPKPIAVWTGDFDTASDGCSLDWHDNQFADGAITIKDGYQGVDVNLASGTSAITVIVKYSDLSYSASNGRMFLTSCADSAKTYDRTAVRLTTGNAIAASHNGSTSSGTAATDYAATISAVPASSGYMVFSYGHPADNNNRGTLVCTGAEEGSLNTTNYWHSGLMYGADSTGSSIYGATVGGSRQQTSTWKNSAGMKIEAIAVFTERLSPESRNEYRFPWPKVPVLTVSPGNGSTATAGSALVMTCDDPAATIWYKKLGDTDYTQYSGPVALDTSGINYYFIHIKDANGNIVVPDEMFTYAVQPAESSEVYYKSGYFGVGGDDALVLTLADGTTPATLAEGGTVIIDDKSSNDIYFGDPLPENVAKIHVARDAVFSSGSGNTAMLGGVTVDVDDGKTLTIKRQWNDITLGAVAINGANAVKLDNADGTITVGGALSGTAPVDVETGKIVHVASACSIANTITGDGTIVFATLPASQLSFGAWTGTVELPVFSASGTQLAFYGVSGSKIKLNGITAGYLMWTDQNIQAEIVLAGNYNITKTSQRNYNFARISGSGDFRVATGTGDVADPASIGIGAISSGYRGTLVNNTGATMSIGRLELANSPSLGTKILATGGTGAVSIDEVYVGGVKQDIVFEHLTNGPDGDGFYAGRFIPPGAVGEFDAAGLIADQLILPVTYTPEGGEETTDFLTGILLVANGKVVLNPDAVVDGVSVRPELDGTAAKPYDADGEKLTVKTIPGLWYTTLYGDALVSGGIGGETTGETEPVQATGATLTLDAPKDGASRFYRIKVVPVKPNQASTLFGIETTETDN